jgi:hypothetical protein
VTVEVSLEAEASAADREAVVRVFESADIQADVRADYIRRSADLLPWLIVIGVVAARFLWAALGGAGDEAGRDTWRGLKSLVTGLYEARRSSESPQGGVSIRGLGNLCRDPASAWAPRPGVYPHHPDRVPERPALGDS